MPSILFVCTANRFRSPLAAAFFDKELLQRSITSEWIVGSAGTWALPELPATGDAIIEAQKRNCDLRVHRSRLIDADVLKSSDLILVMEAGHKEALINEFPQISRKVFLLSEIGGNFPYSIPDPYLTGESTVQIAEEIELLINHDFECILNWFNKTPAGQSMG